ncbi:hypothetical protein VTG60DRAFT_6205 [Thermothelomyces hinnuleus]
MAIATTAAQMKGAFQTLSKSLEKAPQPLNKDEMEMLNIARQCHAVADKLQVELNKICGGDNKGSYRFALSGTVRKIWNQGKIDELEKVLRAHRETLDSRLLQRICKQSDAILLRQSSEFEKLDTDLRRFIEAIAAGETRMARVVAQESESVKEHITLRSEQLRDDIHNHVSSESGKIQVTLTELSAHVASEVAQTRQDLSLRFTEAATSQASEAEHQQLINSLEYETMNARRNQIVDSYEGTFR